MAIRPVPFGYDQRNYMTLILRSQWILSQPVFRIPAAIPLRVNKAPRNNSLLL